jgi:hypothetical protein
MWLTAVGDGALADAGGCGVEIGVAAGAATDGLVLCRVRKQARGCDRHEAGSAGSQ